MPLPTISTPTYELTLPSSGKKIKYRPFLVREEKVLIMALESEDTKQITNSVIDILNSCILSKGIKLETLATFDIEYLFLNIRSKSVGETIDVNIVCPDDNKTQVAVTVDVDSIKIKKDRKHKNVIKLDDNLSLKLKYPSMAQFIDSNFENAEVSGASFSYSSFDQADLDTVGTQNNNKPYSIILSEYFDSFDVSLNEVNQNKF